MQTVKDANYTLNIEKNEQIVEKRSEKCILGK